jgi:hypothetical protein
MPLNDAQTWGSLAGSVKSSTLGRKPRRGRCKVLPPRLGVVLALASLWAQHPPQIAIHIMPNPKKHFDTPCLHCGGIAKGIKVYCNNTCQQAYQSNLLTESWLSGEIEGGNIYGVSSFVRRWVLNRADNKCEKCGWCEIHPTTGKSPLQINHINGDPFNHRPENLEAICPNCHSLTPTFGNLNRGKGRKLNPCLSPGEGRGSKRLPP